MDSGRPDSQDSISALYVDDEEGLLELGKTFLERDGSIHVTTTDDPSFPLEDDNRERFDVIVSDYQMPRMDGIELLKKLKKKGDRTPFIVFTGKGREEVAVEALNNGAIFYVQKGTDISSQFLELSSKIKYAHENKQKDDLIKLHMEAMSASVDGISIQDDNGIHVQSNLSYGKMFGYDVSEITGKSWKMLYDEKDIDWLEDDVLSDMRNVGFHRGRTKGKRKDGSFFPLELSLTVLKNGWIVAIARDITELRAHELEIEERNRRIAVLNEIISMANGCTELSELLSGSLEKILEHMGFESGGIYLIDEDGRKATLRTSKNVPEEFMKLVREVDIRSEPFSRVFIDRQPMTSNHMSEEYGIETEYKSFVSIPLVLEDDSIGSLIATSTSTDKVSDFEMSVLITIGKEMGTAIGRIQVEEKFRRMAEDMERLFDQLEQMVVILTPDGRILNVNRYTAERLGYDEDELERMTVFDLYGTENHAEVNKFLGGLDAGTYDTDIPMITQDGDEVKAETHISMGKWEGENILISITRDLTENKRIMDSLQESEMFNRSLLDNVPDYILTYSLDGRITDINFYAADQLDYLPDKIIGRNLMDIITEECREMARTKMMERTRGKIIPPYEVDILSGKGRTVTVMVKGSKIIHSGAPEVLLVLTDITELKNVESELRKTTELHDLIVENSMDIIWTMDMGGRFTYISPSIEMLTGIPADHALGNHITDFLPEEFHDALQQDVDDHGGREKDHIPEPVRIKWHRTDGSDICMEVIGRTYDDDGGHPLGFVGIARDVTERNRNEETIRNINKKLQILSSITRHDILNQLTVLQGYLELTQKGPLDEKSGRYIGEIEKASRSIQKHIEFTRTYDQLGVHQPEWQSVSDIVENLDDRGLTVNVSVRGLDLYADPMLQKVFYNLLENTVKHGIKATSVNVRYKMAGADCILCWEDDGIGIVDDNKDMIFERGQGDHGFGMFLSREILGITDIKIRETGVSGDGALFEMRVPSGTWRLKSE